MGFLLFLVAPGEGRRLEWLILIQILRRLRSLTRAGEGGGSIVFWAVPKTVYRQRHRLELICLQLPDGSRRSQRVVSRTEALSIVRKQCPVKGGSGAGREPSIEFIFPPVNCTTNHRWSWLKNVAMSRNATVYRHGRTGERSNPRNRKPRDRIESKPKPPRRGSVLRQEETSGNL